MLFKLKSLFVESSFESLLLFEIPGVATTCKDGLKVKFDLMKGTVIIMHMELRYKGGFTSQPQFFGIMSKDFKKVLEGKCV